MRKGVVCHRACFAKVTQAKDAEAAEGWPRRSAALQKLGSVELLYLGGAVSMRPPN